MIDIHSDPMVEAVPLIPADGVCGGTSAGLGKVSSTGGGPSAAVAQFGAEG